MPAEALQAAVESFMSPCTAPLLKDTLDYEATLKETQVRA